MLKFIQRIRAIGTQHSDNLLEQSSIRLMNDLLISILIMQIIIYVPAILQSKDLRTLGFFLFAVTIISVCLYANHIGKPYFARILFCWILPSLALILQTLMPNPPPYYLILTLLLALSLVLHQDNQVRLVNLLYYFTLFGIYSFFVHEHIEITLSQETVNFQEKTRYVIIILLVLLQVARFGAVSEKIEQKRQKHLTQLKKDNLALEQDQLQMQAQNKELENINKELEKFAYVASHDLKSPIRNISGFLKLIQRRLKNYDDQDVHDYLKYATNSATQMYQLVEDILVFSRITERKEEYALLDLAAVLHEAVEQLSDFINSKNGNVVFNDLPTIFAHREQLILLFTALIKNGLLYNCSPIPTVTITYQEQANCHEITVKDNGIGIDAAHFDLIFTIFKRLHTQVEYQGTGVGLAICKKIAKFHKGDITVKSEVHKGSAFIVKLGRGK